MLKMSLEQFLCLYMISNLRKKIFTLFMIHGAILRLILESPSVKLPSNVTQDSGLYAQLLCTL